MFVTITIYYFIFISYFTQGTLIPTKVVRKFVYLYEVQHNHSKVKETHKQHISWHPFITPDAFRNIATYHCDDIHTFQFSPESVTDGQCIFVKPDFVNDFAQRYVSKINASFILISHNGDASFPDGQYDIPRIAKLPRHRAGLILQESYNQNKLSAHFGANLWW
jgi:hypothetical protein